ncbi:MAG: serine/threonine-protein kinase, partial [Planctomycetota bacterium]|nr:serine/threonine-protein kinase [Planctomycetota bacterium]
MQENQPPEPDASDQAQSYPETDPARFARIAELFERARVLAPGEQCAFLLKECPSDPSLRGEVQELLGLHGEEQGPLQEGESAFDSTLAQQSLAGGPALPERIGSYRVVDELGVGGMGRVYRARRADADYEKDVAIKVLRPGLDDPDFLTRFRSERRILARLQHPGVCALLDGGSTEQGQPYLVMEFLEGETLMDYVRGQNLGLRERLALFLQVCDAVSALHRALIVHRDLKPSNIMVTGEGVPKLLDFGIAKILDSDETGGSVAQTITGMMLYTPEYGSPEQAQGKPITTATDVYSLGVLLYELLTDQRPYAFETRTPMEFERVVSGAQAPAMSSAASGFARALRGDLDTIVAMALRKEPERRYGSVALLQEDIERHLKGLPVRAQKDTFSYRASKFLRRRFASVLAAALFLVLLTGFAISMYVQVGRTEKQRDLAQVRAGISDEVSRFLVD